MVLPSEYKSFNGMKKDIVENCIFKILDLIGYRKDKKSSKQKLLQYMSE